MKHPFLRTARMTLQCLLLVSVLVPAAAIAAATESSQEAPVWRYTVKPGDNLINIAGRYFVDVDSWPQVQQANRITDPRRILPGTVLRIAADLLRQAPAQAVLAKVSGEVRWRAADSDWQAASSGLRLNAGNSLETLADASALLVLADASRIVLAPVSLIVLDTLSLYADGLMVDTRMRLQRGQADIQANPERRPGQNLQIRTPSAQAVVRGTQFRVGADADSTREETLGGLVTVSGAGQGVEVPPGRGTVARAGQAPIVPVPLLAAPEVSGLPARFEQLPLRFPLPALAGASEWEGQIAPDTSFERILLSKSVRGQTLTFADLPNGNYVLRLRAIDANGLRGFDALHPFVVFARPFPPGLNAPGNGATVRNARSPFAWSEVVDISRYHVQVASDADFSQMLHDEILERAGWSVSADLPAGKLYWRAASILQDGQQGPWSTVSAFVYSPGPGAADLGQAALEIESDAIRLKLPPPPDGLYYEASLSTSKDLSPALAQARSDDGAIELPQPGAGDYFLGVRLVDRSDNTPGPMSIQKIEVPPSRWWLLLLLIPFGL